MAVAFLEQSVVVQEQDPVRVQEVATSQHLSKAPPRYTEAQLVKTLQQLGIGRPSTYAPVISVLQVKQPLSVSVCLLVCLPVCLPAQPSVRPSICVSACLPACLSVCLSVYLSVCLSCSADSADYMARTKGIA